MKLSHDAVTKSLQIQESDSGDFMESSALVALPFSGGKSIDLIWYTKKFWTFDYQQ